ncbi:MAG: NifU family protein [Phycisphaerales bacterium]
MADGSAKNEPDGRSTTGRTDSSNLHERVAFVIDRIRPAVQNDGGDIELVAVTPSGVVQIRMHGACVGCPSSNMTLRMGIERNLKEHIPEVTAVEAVPTP